MLATVVGEAGGAIEGTGAGVEDAFFGGTIVAGALATGIDAEDPPVKAKVDAGAGAVAAIVGAANAGDVAVDTAVTLVFGFMMTADHVDDAADGTGAVKQCARAADDFDAIEALRIDGFTVVARLSAKGAGTNAVLEDEDTVAIETTETGRVVPGPKLRR